ncbi:MAG: nucleotidyl transferase AbiEii/AbiGii toxin family protein [Candidatus Omnitrophica bacterium]|nr:nucleotidyl transferase AbiEii/AbiGii toxin family protein [Candidatus Omnitrophota bacterium]
MISSVLWALRILVGQVLNPRLLAFALISHEEIKGLVSEWGLREDAIEKDYVIGWVLWGISTSDEIKKSWVFKGGTSLKKCYIDTYRFSEDLDFSVLPKGPVKPEELEPIIKHILERVYEESGIDFSIKKPVFKYFSHHHAKLRI